MHTNDTRFLRIVVLGMGIAFANCDREVQSVLITAQDFRFTPTEIRLTGAFPVHLTIINEGREPHEFESSLLAHRVDGSSGSATSVRVLPNQRTDLMIRTIPGTYIFYCRIRGHGGMSGTVVVE